MSVLPRTRLQSLFGRRSGDHAAPDAAAALQVGDRFYKVGRWESVWTIQRLFVPEGGATLHVKIARDSAPGDTTIISSAVLLDPACFRPDRRAGESRKHQGPWRRRDDDPRLRD